MQDATYLAWKNIYHPSPESVSSAATTVSSPPSSASACAMKSTAYAATSTSASVTSASASLITTPNRCQVQRRFLINCWYYPNLSSKTGRNHPFNSGHAGRGWYEGFMARQPILTLRTLQSLSYARAVCAKLKKSLMPRFCKK